MNSREMRPSDIAKKLAPEHHQAGEDGHSLASHIQLSDQEKRQDIRENSMRKKSLSYLIEAEMEKATVLMAAKEITNKLQKVVEELAEMQPNDVLPLGDAMRELFGSDQAANFEKSVSEKINSLVEAVRDARNAIADQIDALSNGDPMNDLSQSEGRDEMFPDADKQAAPEGDDPFGGEAVAPDAGLGAEDDMSDLDDAFADVDTSSPAGRPQKESFAPAKKVLAAASADRAVARQFAKLVREGKAPAEAGKMIAEQYAMPFNTVVEIITKVRNG